MKPAFFNRRAFGRSIRLFVAMGAFGGLMACTQFPELDAKIPPSSIKGDYPALLPLDQLLDAPAPQISEKTLGNMQSRIAALNARAARLKRPVISTPVRTRFSRGVTPL